MRFRDKGWGPRWTWHLGLRRENLLLIQLVGFKAFLDGGVVGGRDEEFSWLKNTRPLNLDDVMF